jgi:hypothetical protein
MAKTYYFYVDITTIKDREEHYTVIKSASNYCCIADEKAKQFAASKGFKMAGGYFSAKQKPHNFKTNYTVWELPKHFHPKAHKEDFIDRLIAYETGQQTADETKAFFKELQDTGIGKKLQGHYSSKMI